MPPVFTSVAVPQSNPHADRDHHLRSPPPRSWPPPELNLVNYLLFGFLVTVTLSLGISSSSRPAHPSPTHVRESFARISFRRTETCTRVTAAPCSCAPPPSP